MHASRPALSRFSLSEASSGTRPQPISSAITISFEASSSARASSVTAFSLTSSSTFHTARFASSSSLKFSADFIYSLFPENIGPVTNIIFCSFISSFTRNDLFSSLPRPQTTSITLSACAASVLSIAASSFRYFIVLSSYFLPSAVRIPVTQIRLSEMCAKSKICSAIPTVLCA